MQVMHYTLSICTVEISSRPSVKGHLGVRTLPYHHRNRQKLLRSCGLHAAQIYMNAPHAASGDIPQDVAAHFSPPFFEWWNFRKDEDGELSYVGFEEAEASVKQALRQHVSETWFPLWAVKPFSS